MYFGPKVPFCVLSNLYFKTTCNTRPHFHGTMHGLKIEGPLYYILMSDVLHGGITVAKEVIFKTVCFRPVLALRHSMIHTLFPGWVTILAQWIRSRDIALALHATKALANLDRDYGEGRLYPDGVYLYHPQFRCRYLYICNIRSEIL